MITVEEIYRRAKKYKNKIEFCKHDSYSYHIACRHGIVNEVCAHMDIKYTKWDRKKLQELISRYDTLKDFYTNEHRAYEAIKYHGWEDLLKGLKRMREVEN